jgi:hypothetical protein
MSVTTVPLATDLQGPWTDFRVALEGEQEDKQIRDVFPFTSVTDLKRAIWIERGGDPRWAPERVFVGVRRGDGTVRPLEFHWPILKTVTLPDPVNPNSRIPNPALVDEAGNRRPVGPVMTGGLILEDALSLEVLEQGILPSVTAIPLAMLAPAEDAELTPALYHGFYQLYFPWLTEPGQVLDAKSQAPSADLQNNYDAAISYMRDRADRTEVIQRALDRRLGGDRVSMTSMVRMRWRLPPPPGEPESLERVFYSLETSADLPFLRYFPMGVQSSPLIKLALKPDGSPLLDDAKVFAAYLNQPAPITDSSVILGKIPLNSTHTDPGVAFTLLVFKDGSSDLTLEVAQRDQTFYALVAREAEEKLATVMPMLGYEGQQPLLVDLHATYKWIHPNPRAARVLDTQHIQRRLKALTPFFTPLPATASASLATFHWRAVSNYESESAQFAYLRDLIRTGKAIDEGTDAFRTYIQELSQHFGITTDAAAAVIEQFLERRGQAVAPANGPVAGALAVPRHGVGALVSLTSSHPEYTMEIMDVTSLVELQRIVSVVGVMLGAGPGDLGLVPPKPRVEAATNVVELADATLENAAVADGAPTDEELNPEFDEMAAYYAELGLGGIGELMESEAVTSISTSNVMAEQQDQLGQQSKEAVLPDIDRLAEEEGDGDQECGGSVWKPGDPAVKIDEEWYMSKLKKEDEKLFGSWKLSGQAALKSAAATGRAKTYSKSCQRHDGRQPNMMTLAEYSRIRRCYGDTVRFVDLPPRRPEDLPRNLEREKDLQATFAKRHAELAKDKKLDDAEKAKRFQRYKDEQIRKYLAAFTEEDYLHDVEDPSKNQWTVYGYENKTRPGEFLYLMCSLYWCVRDNLPLVPDEFREGGVKGRGGFVKEPNTCPFCGGTPIRKLGAPQAGESVVVRSPKESTGKLHQFIGTITSTRHPNGWLLPCCDTSPRMLEKYIAAAIAGTLEFGKEIALEEGDVDAGEPDAEKTGFKPMQQATITTADTTTIDYRQRLGSMHTQYILGNDKALEAGKIGLLPPILDAFFGQDGPASMETRGIRPTFNKGAVVFVRVGVDNRIRAPGLNLFAGLAPLLGFNTAEETRAAFKRELSPRAFESANYGTLVHEFAARSRLTDADVAGALTAFANDNDYDLTTNRAHVVRLLRAYQAYIDYIDDNDTPKQMRHFEHILASPGLITVQQRGQGGLLVVILEFRDGRIQVACPSFGIPMASAFGSVPVSFLWHDRRDESWEPIVLYNGTKDAVRYFSDRVADPNEVPQPYREALNNWLRTWRSSSEGCGRPAAPPHVWTPNRDTTGLPRLYSLLRDIKRLKVIRLVRDRSNRLAGVIAEPTVSPGTQLFVPALDDGILADYLPRIFEVEAIPSAPLTAYIQFYRDLATDYAAMEPRRYLTNNGDYVGFQVAAGTMIPVPHTPRTTTVPPLPDGSQIVDEFPWERDAALLRAPDAPTLGSVALRETTASVDEQLAEAYQYVRLALSRWLIRDAAGAALRSNIERIVRTPLPLYERRKRMDILLEPVIRGMVATEVTEERRALSLLREDCLSLDEGACGGSCRWSGGRCLIHAPVAAETTDPVRIFVARLSDELLRYADKNREILGGTVETIRTPRGVIRIGNELFMATKPKESGASILQRLGFTGGVAMTFPEELLRFAGLEEAPEEPPTEATNMVGAGLPPAWLKAGFQIPTEIPPLPVDEFRRIVFASATDRAMDFWTRAIQNKRAKMGLPGDPNRPFQWSTQDFYVIATLTLSNILFVHQDNTTSEIVVDRWIAPQVTGSQAKTPFYMIFWGPEELLVTIKKTYLFPSTTLPLDLARAVDAASPMDEAVVRGVVVDTESPSMPSLETATPPTSTNSPSPSILDVVTELLTPTAKKEETQLPPPSPAASLDSSEGQLPPPQTAPTL